MTTYLIGKVLKPRGLRGELKVQIMTNLSNIFGTIKTVQIGEKPYTVISGSVQSGFAYLTLDGINTYEQADLFRDKEIRVLSDQLEIDEDEVLVSDIIGFQVIDINGKNLGTLAGVENYGGGEVLIVGDMVIPYEDEFIVETNMKTKTITVTTYYS